MKNKKFLVLLVITLMAGAAYAQTSPRAERALKDPMRMQKEAKADVYIQSKQKIGSNTIDSASTTQNRLKQEESVKYKRKKSRR